MTKWDGHYRLSWDGYGCGLRAAGFGGYYYIEEVSDEFWGCWFYKVDVLSLQVVKEDLLGECLEADCDSCQKHAEEHFYKCIKNEMPLFLKPKCPKEVETLVDSVDKLIRFVEEYAVTTGKPLTADDYLKLLAESKNIQKVSIGRWAGDMIVCDLSVARKASDAVKNLFISKFK